MTETMLGASAAGTLSDSILSQKKIDAIEHPLEGLTIEAMLDSTTGAFDGSRSTGSLDSEYEFANYNIDTAIQAWDQIEELTHEITSSLMAKQASILCSRFRKREARQQEAAQPPPAKKRRVDVAPRIKQAANEPPPTAAVVTSDEETSHSACSAEETGDALPDDMNVQVDRIGRMSKLVMEIEYCQRELRKEMLTMGEQL